MEPGFYGVFIQQNSKLAQNQTLPPTPYPISVRLTQHYGAIVDAKNYLEPSLSAQMSSSPFPMTTMLVCGPFPARKTIGRLEDTKPNSSTYRYVIIFS